MHDREIAIRALLITGTCGSGKTTVAGLLTANFGWERIAEDDIWRGRFAKNRGAFGSEEHRQKRRKVHEVVFAAIHQAMRYGRRIVIDATVHESPPEAFHEYRDFFERYGVPWTFRVLHPRLEIAQDRRSRRTGTPGAREEASVPNGSRPSTPSSAEPCSTPGAFWIRRMTPRSRRCGVCSPTWRS